jgi:hypothetical protein
MVRTRKGPTLSEAIVILVVSAVLFILLTFTINRVRQSLAEAPRVSPAGPPSQGVDVKRAGSMLNPIKASPVNMLSGADSL